MRQQRTLSEEASFHPCLPDRCVVRRPEGVRGRNSDNTLIKQVLGWAPTTSLREGLGYTHAWISQQVKDLEAKGGDKDGLTTSTVVGQQMAESCDMGSKATK